MTTAPYIHQAEGRGPAWSNSRFEDNAKLSLGFRVSVDRQSTAQRVELLRYLAFELNGPSRIPSRSR